MSKLQIIAISDTHNRHKNIKQLNGELAIGGDIIIHSGDATGRGESGEIEPFIKWYGQLDFRYRIFIAGNHDFGFQKDPARYKKLCEDNGVILLNHEAIEIEGVKIFGSPWTPWFHDWAFNGARNVNEQLLYSKQSKLTPLMKDLWKDIPSDTNILVTHGPPYMILDELVYVDGSPKGQFVGCVDLSERIRELKQLKHHIFGHIHNWGGQTIAKDGIMYHNASICDEMYAPTNPITVIEYEKD